MGAGVSVPARAGTTEPGWLGGLMDLPTTSNTHAPVHVLNATPCPVVTIERKQTEEENGKGGRSRPRLTQPERPPTSSTALLAMRASRNWRTWDLEEGKAP